MVQTLVQENKNLKAKPVTPPPPTPTLSPTPATPPTPPTPTTLTNGPSVPSRTSSSDVGVTMRSKNHVARHCSMYEPREGPPSPRGGAKTPVVATKSASAASTFVAEEVHRRTNLITKRIQDVFRAVQERRVELAEPNAERIVDAVQSMAAVCLQVHKNSLRSRKIRIWRILSKLAKKSPEKSQKTMFQPSATYCIRKTSVDVFSTRSFQLIGQLWRSKADHPSADSERFAVVGRVQSSKSPWQCHWPINAAYYSRCLRRCQGNQAVSYHLLTLT